MSWTRLSIDIDSLLLKSGEVQQSARVKKFIAHVGLDQRKKLFFNAPWESGKCGISVSQGKLYVDLEGLIETAEIGDRIVLEFDKQTQNARAKLLDGTAIVLHHLIRRADPWFLSKLALGDLPREEEEKVGRSATLKWKEILDRALWLAVELEARGDVCLAAMEGWLERQGAELSLLSENGETEVLTSELHLTRNDSEWQHLYSMLSAVEEGFQGQVEKGGVERAKQLFKTLYNIEDDKFTKG